MIQTQQTTPAVPAAALLQQAIPPPADGAVQPLTAACGCLHKQG